MINGIGHAEAHAIDVQNGCRMANGKPDARRESQTRGVT
jgi:hypothetical protein